MDPLSLGLGEIGLVGSIFGAIKSGQANKEMSANIDSQQAQADAFYNNRVNRDFLETNAAKGVVEQLRKRYQEQANQIDSNTAATGGTAESAIAAKTAANESYNEGISNIAQGATQYQDRGEMIHQSKLSDIAQQRMALTNSKNQSAMNLMGGGAQMLGTAADVGAFGDRGTMPPVVAGSIGGVSAPNRTALNTMATDGANKILKNNSLFGNNNKDFDNLLSKTNG